MNFASHRHSVAFISLSLSPPCTELTSASFSPSSFLDDTSEWMGKTTIIKNHDEQFSIYGRVPLRIAARMRFFFPLCVAVTPNRRLSVCGGCGDPPPPAYQVDAAQHPSHSCISGTKAGVAPSSARLLEIMHAPRGSARRQSNNTRGTSGTLWDFIFLDRVEVTVAEKYFVTPCVEKLFLCTCEKTRKVRY